MKESGLISISLKEPTPLSLFTNVFDQEILLSKQTFMEKKSHQQEKNSHCSNVRKKLKLNRLSDWLF